MPAPLRVALGHAPPQPGEALLAELCLSTDEAAGAERRWSLGLRHLAGAKGLRWYATGPVRDILEGDWRISAGPGVAWAGICTAIDAASVASQTEALFLSLHEQARVLGTPFVQRLWVIIPDIHHGAGDAERYKQFCIGRHQAYEQLGLGVSDYPAATVVGSRQGPLRLYALLGESAGLALENPRQVSAYHYPRVYGPRSPSFSRARDIGTLLMISGTAAVIGAESQHGDDALAQLNAIDANLQALRAQCPQHHQASYGQLYVRHRHDASALRARLVERIPAAHDWPILEADICRADLLCEIEAAYA